MPFLGQVRCEELVPFDLDKVLPAAGMLYFFFFDESYEIEVPPDYSPTTGGVSRDLVHGFHTTHIGPEWHSRIRVIYSDQTDSLTRRTFPPNLPANPASAKYKPCRLSFGHEITLPGGMDGWIGLGPWDRALHMFDEESVRPYRELFDQWRGVKGDIHQMLGHPDMFSHGPGTPEDLFPEDEVAQQLPPKERLISAAKDRRLLLQLQSGIESLTGISFNRDFFVFIREQDLRRRDFTRVWWDMSE